MATGKGSPPTSRVTEARLLMTLERRGDREGARAAAALLEQARELGAILGAEKASLAVKLPPDPARGTREINLFLLAQDAGTLWLRKQEKGDWGARGYDRAHQDAYYQTVWSWFPNARVEGYSWEKQTNAPQLRDVARRLPEFLQLLRETVAKLRGSVAPSEEADATPLEIAKLDEIKETKVRLEQHLLRKLLLDGSDSLACALCGETFPAPLLVAAHIKRRADCSDEERRDHASNVLALCAFGCDALFERGYVVVEDGVVLAGPTELGNAAVAQRVEHLAGRPCTRWGSRTAPFFAAHRRRFSGR